MDVTSRYPDKEYQPDYSNQSDAIKLSKTKWVAAKYFLTYGSLLFVSGLIFLALKLIVLAMISYILYGAWLLGIFLFGVLTFPQIRCSKCQKRMKRKTVNIGGGYDEHFLICESCKLYVDTGHGSGA